MNAWRAGCTRVAASWDPHKLVSNPAEVPVPDGARDKSTPVPLQVCEVRWHGERGFAVSQAVYTIVASVIEGVRGWKEISSGWVGDCRSIGEQGRAIWWWRW